MKRVFLGGVLFVGSAFLGQVLLPAGEVSQPAAGNSATQPAVRLTSGLKISELSVDFTPGVEGSWIELYNPDANALPGENISIRVNGEPCCEVPRDLTIPSKGILMIRFARAAQGSLADVQQQFTDYNAATITLAAARAAADPKREPGYCALFKGKPTRETMLDFVWWGRARNVVPPEYVQWAKDLGLWNDLGIFLGTDAAPGDPPTIPAPAVLSRVSFNTKMLNRWQMIMESRSTPGSANVVPPPYVMQTGRGRDVNQDITFVISFPSGIQEEMQDGQPYDVQIAQDPCFENVIQETKCGSSFVLRKGVLPSGKYFIRVRCNAKNRSTNWSPADYFLLS